MKAFLVVLIGAVVTQFAVFAVDMPKVGDKAPDFSVAASDGTTVRLKDYLGKGNIILYFYPKGELQKDNVEVVGVSFDSVDSHKSFIAKYKLPFVLLADTGKSVAKLYGVADEGSKVASRVTFVINKAGKIAFVDPKVNPATHAAELRTVLNGLSQ